MPTGKRQARRVKQIRLHKAKPHEEHGSTCLWNPRWGVWTQATIWCPRSKEAFIQRGKTSSVIRVGIVDAGISHQHHCHDTQSCFSHPYTVFIFSPWLLKRFQGYYLGSAETLEKDILVTNYIILLEHSLALCLPSVPMQGEKCVL